MKLIYKTDKKSSWILLRLNLEIMNKINGNRNLILKKHKLGSVRFIRYQFRFNES